MSVLAVLLVLAVAAYVRLAQGPVLLDFLRGTVESKINQALPSMAVSIGGLVMERTGSAGVPHVRLTELRLNDKQGNYLASAFTDGTGASANFMRIDSITVDGCVRMLELAVAHV